MFSTTLDYILHIRGGQTIQIRPCRPQTVIIIILRVEVLFSTTAPNGERSVGKDGGYYSGAAANATVIQIFTHMCILLLLLPP